MPAYKLPDGRVFDAPDKLTPEQSAYFEAEGAKKQTPNGWADAFKAGMSGLYEGAVRTPFILGDLSTAGMNLVDRTFNKDAPQRRMQSDQVLDILREKTGKELYVPETTAGRYANSVGNAVGGSFLGGTGALRGVPALTRAPGVGNAVKDVVARSLQTPVVGAAAAGGASELAGDASRGFDTTREQNPIARLAGGVTGAVGSGVAARMAAPRYENMIHQATKELSPADFAAAQKLNTEMKAAGATVQTIPDTLPSTSSLRGVAQEISNAPGGQALNTKLAGRDEGEISRLLGEAKGQMQRSAVPNVSMLPGAPGADQFIADVAKSNRTSAMLPDLRNAPLLEEQKLQSIVEALQKRSSLPRNAGTDDARYSSGAASAVNSLPRYRIPSTELALTKSLELTPAKAFGPGTLVSQGDGNYSYSQTQLGVEVPRLPSPYVALPPMVGKDLQVSGAPGTTGLPASISPAPKIDGPLVKAIPILDVPYARADSRFKFPSDGSITDINPIAPALKPPYPERHIPKGVNLEALSKVVKSLQNVDAMPTGPAGQVLKNSAALGAAGAASGELKRQSPAYRAAMEKYGELSPQFELTQLLADNKLKPVANTAKSSLATDNAREQIASLMSRIDPANAPMVSGKLQAADQLSKLRGEMGAANLEAQYGTTPIAKLAAPFSSISRASNIGMRLGINEQVAGLLANPTPANYRILEQMSRNDPALRKILADFGRVGSVNAVTQTQGSNP